MRILLATRNDDRRRCLRELLRKKREVDAVAVSLGEVDEGVAAQYDALVCIDDPCDVYGQGLARHLARRGIPVFAIASESKRGLIPAATWVDGECRSFLTLDEHLDTLHARRASR